MAKRYFNLASGWIKANSQTGEEFISASCSGKSVTAKLFAELEDGTKVPVTSFVGSFNKQKKSEKSPDLSFSFSIED